MVNLGRRERERERKEEPLDQGVDFLEGEGVGGGFGGALEEGDTLYYGTRSINQSTLPPPYHIGTSTPRTKWSIRLRPRGRELL